LPPGEDGLRRCVALATEGVAARVGVCEAEVIAHPQEAQNRAPSSVAAEQLGQRITVRAS
jgi:hypothetical protein